MPTPSLPTLTIARSVPRDVDVLVVGLSSEGPSECRRTWSRRTRNGSAPGWAT